MASFFRADGWVKSSTGPAVPGAQIFVCNQPANTPTTLSPIAPSPLAAIYSDPNGLVPITQPIITDGFGHYDFYAASGVYTVVVYLSATLQQVYPDQTVGSGSAPAPAFTGNQVVAGWPGLPPSSQIVCIYTAPFALTFPANFSGSVGSAGVKPTSTAVYNILKWVFPYVSSTVVGTVSISTAGVFTFATTGGAPFSLAIGDRLTATAPSSQDGTLSDAGFTLFSNRT